MNTVYSIGEQFGKSPDEIVEWDTATFTNTMIWNSIKSKFSKELQRIKSE